MTTSSNIQCPKCKHEFDIQNVLVQKANEQIHAQQVALEQEKLHFENSKEEARKNYANKLIEDRRKIIEESNQQNANDKKLWEEALEQKSKQQQTTQNEENAKLRKELGNTLAAIKNMQNKIDNNENEKQKIEIELRQKIQQEEKALSYQQAKAELDRINNLKIEQLELTIKEKDIKIDEQKKLTDEMKRKQEQGSMQTQGEVQELLLEEFLKSNFTYDLIEEVGKGTKGADVIQRIFNQQQQECGTIIYESKRTQQFSYEWISKLKNDQTQLGAVLAILVTQTMPKEMPFFGQKDGVWICTFLELKMFIKFIRESIIKEHKAKSHNENIEDKKQRLYDYLISQKFAIRIENIVKGFKQLKDDLEKEKLIFQKHWKKREEELSFVIENTIEMYGSIQGIGGNVIPQIGFLELP